MRSEFQNSCRARLACFALQLFAFGLEGEAHSARPRPAHLNLCEKYWGGENLAFPPVLTGIIGVKPASVKACVSSCREPERNG